jgi:hypothetical protein
MYEIADNRPVFQYYLLSLHSASDSSSFYKVTSPSVEDPELFHLYEVCRYTALMYSITVIAPIQNSDTTRHKALQTTGTELHQIPPRTRKGNFSRNLLF